MSFSLSNFLEKKWCVLIAWQLTSVVLCSAGTMCTYISIKFGTTIPFLMVFITYVFLLISSCWKLPKAETSWWRFLVVAIATICGDYTGVRAYSSTSLSSALTLCTTTIFWVVPLSYFVFGRKINLKQFFAIILGVGGGALIFIADGTSGSRWLGNVLAIVSAICYSVATVLQEYLVHNDSFQVYLFRFSAFAAPITSVCSGIVEWKTIRDFNWNWESILLIIAYSILLMLYDVMAPYIMQYSDATTMNLSLLTSNFYSLAISILAFGQMASWIYLLGFFCIPVAILIFTLSEKKTTDGLEEEEKKSTVIVQSLVSTEANEA
ncbi:Integral membrane protein [Histomonas meleagridis]|uniref:Integral membrane protein n=1 Tax=Histomonas meleagridis TaxID=135588 RepID=UPI003559556E|nr:Integral membrane protein [Histomonas meleagridis]KAH0798806.1 Integral membrane protein [Histomonas meleagridis]